MKSNTKTVELPEDDPDVFEQVVAYMYGGLLGAASPARGDWKVIVSAYILADKLCMPRIQNAMTDKLRWSNYLGLILARPNTEVVVWV